MSVYNNVKNINLSDAYRNVLFLIGMIITPVTLASELTLEETFSTQITNGWESVER